MPSKPLLYALLSFWALSIIGSPLAWLCQSDETIAISINTSEEESGKTVKVDPLEEKLIVHRSPLFEYPGVRQLVESTFRYQNPASDFFGEVVLPPPEV